MSEEQNIEEHPEDDRPSPDDSEKSAEATSFTSDENETVTEENIQHSAPNIQDNNEPMEVHHHGHVHEKKKWIEYVFQFFMLFLAVFCGFLAEYQLEHKIEKDREKQFITSLVADLQDDAKILDAMMQLERQGIASLDTLIDLLNTPEIAKQNGDQLYYVARMGPRSNPFANNSRTFDQLKNAGGFRLIRKSEASNKIMGYYNQFFLIRLLEDNYNHEFDNFKHVAAKILDPEILRKQESDKGTILRSNYNPSLRTYDADLLKELGFHVLQMNGSRRTKILLLENIKNSGEDLMSFLKKQYHLE